MSGSIRHRKSTSYYKEMFDTGYVLDYLAAQAFFELTPHQQAAVAVQAEHTAGGNASMTTTYKKLTAEEIDAMDLDSMEDLWDNRISVRKCGVLSGKDRNSYRRKLWI